MPRGCPLFHGRSILWWLRPSLPRGLWIGPCGLAMFLAAPGGCWLSLREPPWSVLGSLGVRDPGARAGAFACAYGCFSRGRLVAAGSVSGWPGGAGRSRGHLPGS
ncbi:hypothetical protein V6N11_007319 [Hibiscus sabdariffa]|uniref:Uncharacterized protein n=2 Tax=Hibiscus sabdariffa TaxID=183260 RepID=A0ABR1ZU67_9ROSI